MMRRISSKDSYDLQGKYQGYWAAGFSIFKNYIRQRALPLSRLNPALSKHARPLSEMWIFISVIHSGKCAKQRSLEASLGREDT